MTSFRPLRPLLLLFPLVLAASAVGCGNDTLSVRGEAAVAFSADYVERFDFEVDTQLEKDDLEAGVEGVFGGHCVLSQTGLTAVDVEIERPGAVGGLTSYRVQAAVDEGGQMRAVVDGIIYEGDSEGGACTIRALYAMHHDRTAGLEVDCTVLDADGNAAQATADLHFVGCLAE
jgi:hypothetical protein